MPAHLQQFPRKGNNVGRDERDAQLAFQLLKALLHLVVVQSGRLGPLVVAHELVDPVQHFRHLVKLPVALALEAVDDVLAKSGPSYMGNEFS